MTRLTHNEKGHGESHLCRVDARTRRIEQLPNNFKLWSPRWSPDGKWIAALDENLHLRLYDMAMEHIAAYEAPVLTSFAAGYPDWSGDGKYKLPGRGTTLNISGWVGRTPDGTIVSARSIHSSNLYALELGSQ